MRTINLYAVKRFHDLENDKVCIPKSLTFTKSIDRAKKLIKMKYCLLYSIVKK